MHIAEVVEQVARYLDNWYADDPPSDPIITSARLIHHRYPEARIHFLHFDGRVKITGEYPEGFRPSPEDNITIPDSLTPDQMALVVNDFAKDYLARIEWPLNWSRRQQVWEQRKSEIMLALSEAMPEEASVIVNVEPADYEKTEPVVEMHIYDLDFDTAMSVAEVLRVKELV